MPEQKLHHRLPFIVSRTQQARNHLCISLHQACSVRSRNRFCKLHPLRMPPTRSVARVHPAGPVQLVPPAAAVIVKDRPPSPAATYFPWTKHHLLFLQKFDPWATPKAFIPIGVPFRHHRLELDCLSRRLYPT